MEQRQNILVVEVNAETYGEIASLLKRISFEVDWLPTATSALELVTVVPFKALILNHPLATVPLEEFLTRARGAASASREASVALLAVDAEEAQRHAGGPLGVDLVLADAASPEDRQRELCMLLGIQPRSATRILVRLEITLGEATLERFVAQTKNLSTSGVFVMTSHLLPVGSRTKMILSIPKDPSPFVAEAEVVRHSDGRNGAERGMGLRFVSFSDGRLDRLERFLGTLDP